jgi:hypothetical protein
LDLCTYGVYDAATLTTDMTVCDIINPYHVTYVVYVDDPNLNDSSFSPTENTEILFYVWPKDPCYQAILTPDTTINANVAIIYFLRDTEVTTSYG